MIEPKEAVMGSWGLGPFDDDKALDWLDGLSSSAEPGEVLIQTLQAARASDYLFHTQSVQALASVEVLLAVAGSPMVDLPEEVGELLAEHRLDFDICELLKESRSTTQAIRERSELRTTREKSLALDEWTVVIDELISRLDSAISRACGLP